MAHKFVHLNLHSEYALVDGMIKLPALFSALKAQGATAVALTDQMNLFALVKFYQQALKSGIKPIVGADVLVYDDAQKATTPLTILCRDNMGYRHLTELLSSAYLTGYQAHQPTIKREDLLAGSSGLLLLASHLQGDVAKALKEKDAQPIAQLMKPWLDAFPDAFYLTVSRTGQENETLILNEMLNLAGVLNLPVVAVNHVRFVKESDFEAHEARVSIHQGFVLADPRRPKNYTKAQYLKSPDEMGALFSDIPGVVENTIEIAKRCNVSLTLGDNFLPQFPIPKGLTTEDYLSGVAKENLNTMLAKKEGIVEAEYHARLDLELSVINQMGFPGYFLIVADFIQWAKDQGIPVGPGRGSGAGSLVAYVLGITALDPLEHALLFERFLNPERVSMPDFDIDFCMERRDEVIAYVAERYGRNAVSQIITYGTMAAKAVVRDVGRVLGLPYGFVDTLAKLVPFELGMTLSKALIDEDQLSARYQEEEEVRSLIDLALKLEGVVRNAGKHAGGVLIAPGKITDFSPIYCEEGSTTPVSQFDKDDVEAVGLVKFDFLGLRTLTIIDWAVSAINKRLAKEGAPLVDIETIPLDCKKTFSLLKSCDTDAVFQLESRGMKDLIKRLGPDNFGEITALVALFRPGPLQSGMVDTFIDRKHGRLSVEYQHPGLESILESTYGVILYQEQVMKIAQVLANYTLGGADILRRAMGKKKPEEMARQRDIFLKGCVENDIAKETANEIFDLMEKFAGYGFNKSHSAAYALLAYQTAWLKAHYPAEFMAAVLSSDMDNTDKVVGFLDATRSLGVKINPPNINVGIYHFAVNNEGCIEYGLGAIKGVGESIINQIVATREADGPYACLFDLCHRLDTRKLNRRVLDALIKSGALDAIAPHRASALASINDALKSADQAQKNAERGQSDMFSVSDESKPVLTNYHLVNPWLTKTRLAAERETLGHYVSGHPLALLDKEITHFSSHYLLELAQAVQKTVVVTAILLGVRVVTTKSGRRIGILSIEDRTGRAEASIFGELFESVRGSLEKGSIVVLKGLVEKDDFNGGYRIRVEKVSSISEVRVRLAKGLEISFSHEKINELAHLPQVLMTFKSKEGKHVRIKFTQKNANISVLALSEKWSVALEETLLDKMATLYGEENVKVLY